ncbi:sulfite reductase flavoprotein subunit alpha, partial [Staphylococcus aureus]|nr:sulfite reductase flavoprotein subunit alpha [Staphylococcus aureus]
MKLNTSNSPFTEKQVTEINNLLQTLTESQQQWLSGFLLANSNDTTSDSNQQQLETEVWQQSQISEEQATSTTYMLQNKEPHIEANQRHVTVLYGSESGNAMRLAEIFSERLSDIGHQVVLMSMDEYDTTNIAQLEDLFIITSTHGEGEPPDNAWDFFEFLEDDNAPNLNHVRYSVLALGDQTYEFFCQAGKDVDALLENLGAERICKRVDCDIDYEEDAEKWMADIINMIDTTSEGIQSESVISESIKSAKEKKYSKLNPYQAEVLANINLNGTDSNKETRHIEFLLDDFSESYEPGDCIVALPQNDPELVEKLISMLGWDPQSPVPINDRGDT